MADPVSAAALREVAAAIRALADTLQEPLLQAASALSQVEATLASLDGQAVATPAALPADAAALPAEVPRQFPPASVISPLNDEVPRQSPQASVGSPLNDEVPRQSPSHDEGPCFQSTDAEVQSPLQRMARSPESPQGPTTGRRLSQAAYARHSKF